MMQWPTSLPDYKWPPHLLSLGMAALRWLLAGVFHVAYAIGLAFSLLHRGERRALVIRTDGLGDALLFEPALENLGRALSPREIHLWAPKPTCELLANCPTIRRLVPIPRGFKHGNLLVFGSFLWRARLGWNLGRWQFDIAVYPVQSPEPLGNWLLLSARAAERWLNYGDTSNQFDWQRARAHERATRIIESRPGHAHELLCNEYLASQWSDRRSLRRPKLHLTEDNFKRAEELMAKWRSSARSMGAAEVVGVVAASAMHVNSYPDAKWAAALKRLWDQQRVMAVLLGGPDDADALNRLAGELVTSELPHLRMNSPLPILDMAALVGQFDGILSVDTALAHMAVAQRVPTVVLSACGHPGRFFPWPGAAHHIVLSVPMPCAGCNNRCTLAEPRCITQITPEQIATAYARLKGRRAPLEIYIARPAPLQRVG